MTLSNRKDVKIVCKGNALVTLARFFQNWRPMQLRRAHGDKIPNQPHRNWVKGKRRINLKFKKSNKNKAKSINLQIK